MILQANNIHTKAGVPYLYGEIDFKIKEVTTEKHGHFIIIEGHYIKRNNICFPTIHAPNQGALKYIEQLQTELNEEIDKHNNSWGP